MTAKNAFYAQSGGVTAVINASACGVIETARAHSDKIANVYAGRNGIIGALVEELIDTSQESAEDIAAKLTRLCVPIGRWTSLWDGICRSCELRRVTQKNQTYPDYECRID